MSNSGNNFGQNSLENRPRFVPGSRVSVQLDKCGHRTRTRVGREALEVGSGGWLMVRRAHCPRCRRWRKVLHDTARKPQQNATRTVVGEREEVRDGRVFRVTVFRTPRRAR